MREHYEAFEVSIEDKVAHIRLNRPEAMNAMNRAFWNELPEIVEEIDGEALARVIVLSSTGKHFSAGMDLSVFSGEDSAANAKGDRATNAEMFRSNIRYIQHSFNVLEEARMPVLCAIQGGAIGGGVDMASACDVRWCTRDAFFCIQEINIAMTADVGTFPRLQRLMPEGWLRQIAYTGERLPAEKALALGLVNEVFDSQEQMLDHAMRVARDIASKDPLAVTGSKVLINYGRDHTTADTLDYIGVWNAAMFPPARMAEAFAAKQEGRAAEFTELRKLRRKPM